MSISDDIVKLTSELVRFRTTADNPSEQLRCADFLAKQLQLPSIIVRRYEKNGKHSLVALFEQTKHPLIFFNAHFDVVPASIHAFEPKVEDDWLFGRGSEDCKAQVALLVLLMRHFASQHVRPNIGIMLTGDEEVHGHDGVRFLLEEEGYSCDFAVVADGGDNFDIVTKHKGVLQVRISAVGKSAHSSRYWEGGENAIEKLMAAYAGIQKLFPKLHSAAWKTTANLAKISGGDALNKVPDYAELLLDIRRTEQDSEEDIMRKLAGIFGIQVEKVASADMLNTSSKNPFIAQLKASAQKVLGREVRTYHEHGATDARYFSALGIPAVLFKPIGFGAHSESERLQISSLEPYYRIIIDFMESAASVPRSGPSARA